MMREQRGTSMVKRYSCCLFALAAALMAGSVAAQTSYTDNFQGTSANLKWTALGDACLTAGGSSSSANGNIPSCSSKGFLTDTVGQGALLLTPAQNNQTGAILSAFTPFPLSQGIQVTFTTYTFGGSHDGLAGNGADGIVFMLTDGTDPNNNNATVSAPTATGGEGGSMGYGCSNGNGVYDGIAYGYLGLGIDEFGNFLNSGDNGSQGVYNSNDPSGTKANGTNTYYSANGGVIGAGTGPQYQPERIGLRGAGNTNWAWLQAKNSSYYSGSSTASKVQAACKSGQYVSGGSGSRNSPYQYTSIPYNYNPIAGGYAVLPNSQPIANNSSSATRNPAAGTAACVGNSPACTIAWPITYKLSISSKGLLNFSYSYNNGVFQPVLTNTDITKSNGPLPASLRFGFSAGTGGSNNVHEITCFQASPLSSTSSAAANTIQSGEVKTGTQIYLAAYSNNNWWGSMQAVSLVTNNGVLAASNVANWDAKCVLTGGPCDTMGTDATGTPTNNITVQSPSSRILLTSNGNNDNGGGESLEWTGGITAAQQGILNTNSAGTVDNNGQIRLNWLRGDRTQEQGASSTAPLRQRTYVLGDIIDSSPTWVGAPMAGTYPNSFSDGLYGGASTAAENQAGAQTYSTFASNNVSRLNVTYVGGNDGIMHGFESGSFDSNGNFTSAVNGSFTGTNNDGKEVIGYMPAGVLANKSVSLTNPNYVHDYMVDATPALGDLFYGSAWHTWLVGGVGSSGKEIYALDVTNPSNFSESNAGSLVIGDWTNASSGLSHLGNTVGSPIIARMHNGQWAIIFGNGLSSNTSAGIYIGLVDKTTGAVTYQFLDTGVGSSSSANGIAYVTSVDLDGDHIADYLYAGDLKGNVWRFDVTSSSTSNWAASKFGNSTPTPMFVAKDSSNNLQPITTAIVAAAIQTNGVSRVMLYFGTGQKIPQTTTSGDTYSTGTQTFYGIWDSDMGNWNSLSSVKYASLATGQSFTSSNLLAQTSTETNTTTGSVSGYRYLSTGSQVCWQGTTTCSGGSTTNNQFGWMYNLPDTNEQIIYNPTIIEGAVVVNTAIPPSISATQCKAGQQTGWTMAFDPTNGGGLPQGFFPNSSGAFGTGSNGTVVSGVGFNGVGTPTAVTYNGQTYMVSQTVTGTPVLSRVNPKTGNSPARVSWREIRN
jgi:type IV pilus assembly protein PilY1